MTALNQRSLPEHIPSPNSIISVLPTSNTITYKTIYRSHKSSIQYSQNYPPELSPLSFQHLTVLFPNTHRSILPSR